eukprot:scaffold6.g2828.t1
MRASGGSGAAAALAAPPARRLAAVTSATSAPLERPDAPGRHPDLYPPDHQPPDSNVPDIYPPDVNPPDLPGEPPIPGRGPFMGRHVFAVEAESPKAPAWGAEDGWQAFDSGHRTIVIRGVDCTGSQLDLRAPVGLCGPAQPPLLLVLHKTDGGRLGLEVLAGAGGARPRGLHSSAAAAAPKKAGKGGGGGRGRAMSRAEQEAANQTRSPSARSPLPAVCPAVRERSAATAGMQRQDDDIPQGYVAKRGNVPPEVTPRVPTEVPDKVPVGSPPEATPGYRRGGGPRGRGETGEPRGSRAGAAELGHRGAEEKGRSKGGSSGVRRRFAWRRSAAPPCIAAEATVHPASDDQGDAPQATATRSMKPKVGPKASTGTAPDFPHQETRGGGAGEPPKPGFPNAEH